MVKRPNVVYLGHALVENRSGLIAVAMATIADSTAERNAALLLVGKRSGRGGGKRVTAGADKAYDARDFVSTVQELGATPHVSQNNKNRRSAIDQRTARQAGYGISLSKRWLVEKPLDGCSYSPAPPYISVNPQTQEKRVPD